MQTVKLIRRDLPLEQGRRLRFEFTVAYVVDVDEDVLYGDKDTTLDELERRLADARPGGPAEPELLLQGLSASGADHAVIEHKAQLLDIEREPGETCEFRFEHGWERDEREHGRADQWTSREWLAEVPAKGPERQHPTAAEVMEQDG